MPKLIVYPGSGGRETFELDQLKRVSVGRDSDSNIVVPRRMASREHALIEVRDGRHYIVDRDSYNGTFLNQRPVREAKLQDGDEIRVASYVLRFIDSEFDELEDTIRLPRDDDTLSTDPQLPAIAPAAGESAPVSTSAASVAAAAADPLDPAVAGSLDEIDEIDHELISAASDESPKTSSVAVPPPRPSASKHASDWRAWLLVAAFLGVTVVLFMNSSRSASKPPPPAPTVVESRAFERAMAAPPAERLGQLWGFIDTSPTNDTLRGRAYLALLASGESQQTVCDHARLHARSLLAADAALGRSCAE